MSGDHIIKPDEHGNDQSAGNRFRDIIAGQEFDPFIQLPSEEQHQDSDHHRWPGFEFDIGHYNGYFRNQVKG